MKERFGSYIQQNWDWRAAGNFILGGAGGALLLMAAAASYPQSPPLAQGLSGLALVGAGLFLVWLEIGRPLRALHVFFHPQTSWMTREAFVALVTFALALIGILTANAIVIGLAGVGGLVFLYCQAQILKASKGIPAWREPALVPLILTTGLTEGTGLLLLLVSAVGMSGDAPAWLAYLLLALLVVRIVAWTNYRAKLTENWAPEPALAALSRLNVPFTLAGNILPAALLIVAWIMPAAEGLFHGLAAVLAIAAGWLMKFAVIRKAAYVQGYGLATPQPPRAKPEAQT